MTTGDDDDDGDIEGVGDVVTCTSPVPLVPLGTIIALEDCDRDRQPHNTIRMTDRTSQLRASALLNSPSRSQVARSALRRLFRSSLLLLCRRCCCCSCRSVLCSLGAHAPPPSFFLWYCASHLRAVSLARCLRGSGGGRRRHESRRQDSRRRPVVVVVWPRRALWCILDLNKKGRLFTRASPPAASGRLRSPPATFCLCLPPHTTGLRLPCGGRSLPGELRGWLGWLGRGATGARE
jgi:hypothetical protein